MKVFVDDHPVTGTVDFGSVPDGVDTGTAFTGTDNSASLQAALDYASPRKLQVIAPPGVYRFSGVTVNDTGVITLPSWVWLIAPGATFLVDEDTSITNMPVRDFMRSTGWNTTMSRTLNELCRIEGLTWKGRWSHVPLTTAAAKGMHFLAAGNYREMVLQDTRAFDCRGNFSRCWGCESVTARGNRLERICSDALRFTDSINVLVDGNFVRDTGDNAISLHSAATRNPAPYTNRPTRGGLVVTNNRMVNCVTPNFLGAHSIVFSGNVMQRCNGGVTIGVQAPPEGTGSQTNIVVTGNLIEDTLQRYDGTPFPAQVRSSGALTLGGAVATADSSAAPPGEYHAATTSVISPWGDGTPAPTWGYLWSGTSQPISGATEQSTAGTFNLLVSGNIIARTLPAVAHYSDWGQGQLFAVTGYANPAVTDADWRQSGVVMSADVRNFLVSDNIISGHRAGPGIYLHVTGFEVLTDMPFRGGVIATNVIVDCRMGLTTHRAADLVSPPLNSDLMIVNNRFDIDPYHKSSYRTSPIDGTWPNSADTPNFPSGINCQGYKGWTIRGNTFSNAYIPVGPNLVVAYANTHLETNLVYCDPVAAGWNAGNKGIANVPQASNAYRHLIIDGNPASATWRAVKNTLPQSANAMPTTGTVVEGQVVYNLTPSVAAGKVLLGWMRLTTGSTHVAGTDWSPLYCTVA